MKVEKIFKIIVDRIKNYYMGIGSLESHINDISEIYRVANDGRRMDIIWKKY